MKTKLRRFGAWLMALALAFAGANAWGYVAKTADGQEFDDLASALAAVSPSNPLAEVSAAVWDGGNDAWYNGTVYQKLADAIRDANAANSDDAAVIYCYPGKDKLTVPTHIPLKTSITIYGNNAHLKQGWEPSVEAYHTGNTPDETPENETDGVFALKKDVSHAFYNLHDGAGFWGFRRTNYRIDVLLENCNNVHEILVNNQVSGFEQQQFNIVARNCTFSRDSGWTEALPFTTTWQGSVTVEDCTFDNAGNPFNLNLKNGGRLDVVIRRCSFAKCGSDGQSFGSIRLTGLAGEMNVLIEEVTITDSIGNASQGEGITVGNKKGGADNGCLVSYEIRNTSAKLAVFLKDGAANELKFPVEDLVPAKTYVGNNAAPEVVIDAPTKEDVVAKTEGEVSGEQKSEKAAAVVAVIEKAADEESLEVRDSGLQAAAKTSDGKLAEELVTALKNAAGDEKKEEITSATAVKKTIDVVFKGMTVEAGENVKTTKLAYDVTPMATATLAGGEKVEAKIPNGTFGKINFRMPLTADFAGRWLKVSRTDDGSSYTVVGFYKAQKEGDVDYVQVDADHFSTYVNEITDEIPPVSIGGKGYATLAAALAAVKEGETINLGAGTFEEGEITLPDTIKNVTIRGAAGHASVLKNTTLAHRTNGKSFDGLAIDGIVFDGGRFLLVDWGAGSVKNLTFTNNIFRNLNDATNEAAIELNTNEGSAPNGFVFTGNVIENCLGGQKSGLYGSLKGSVLISGNAIHNVAFRPLCFAIVDNGGEDDTVTIVDNTFSGTSIGRLQVWGNGGDDMVVLTISNNVFKDVTDSQQICCWSFADDITADFAGNYYDQPAESSRIYWQEGNVYLSDPKTASGLPHAGHEHFGYYTGLRDDGTIDPATLVEVVKPPVAKIGDETFATLSAAVSAAESGATIILLDDIELDEGVTIDKKVTIDFDGHSISSEGLVFDVTAGAFGLKGSAIVAGEGDDGYAIVFQSDTVLTVDGENVVNGAIYAYAGLSVVGADPDEDMLTVNAPEMKAFEICGDDFAANKVGITMNAKRGVIIQEDREKITIAIADAHVVGGETVERLIQSWPDNGAIDVTVTNSVLSGCGSVMICTESTGKRQEDVIVSIVDSQVTLTGLASNEAELISSQAAYGDATLIIDNSTVVLTQNNDEMMGINVGTQVEKDGHGLAKGIIRNNSRVEISGAVASFNIWTWGANNTLGTVLDIDNSELISKEGGYYGIEAYAWGKAAPTVVSINGSALEFADSDYAILLGLNPDYSAYAGPLALNVTNSTLKASDVFVGVYLSAEDTEHDVTYVQTDSDVSLDAEYSFYAVGGIGEYANPKQKTAATIVGGSFEATGYAVVVGDAKGTLTMDTDASFEKEVEYLDLYIPGGKYKIGADAILFSYNTDNVTGGIFNEDMSEYVSEGYVCVPNTDAATKAEYPWMIGLQQLQPKTNTAEAEASEAAKEAIPGEKQGQIPAAVNTVKTEVAEAATSKEVTQFTGTGLSEAVVKPDGSLDPDVVKALKAAATDDDAKQKIAELSSDSNSTKRIDIELKKIDVGLAVSGEAVVGSANEVTYDVVPRVKTVIEVKNDQGEVTSTIQSEAKVPNETIAKSPITFRLGVTWVVGEQVKVLRDNVNFGITHVQGEGDKRYVELTSNHFSEFKLLKVNVPTVCKVNGQEFETIADAITASADWYDTTIELLADIAPDVVVSGLGMRVIDTNGKEFLVSQVQAGAGEEVVSGKGGKVYTAAPKVEVPTGANTVMPIRGYVALTDDPATELAGTGAVTGNKVWQDYALFGNSAGAYVKLTPQIVKAAEDSSVVTIKAAGDYVLSKPVRSGVAVSFQLLKREGTTGNFAAYGEPSATPEFTVDVKKIGPKTFWKIQTIFSCEEERL